MASRRPFEPEKAEVSGLVVAKDGQDFSVDRTNSTGFMGDDFIVGVDSALRTPGESITQ